jgi:hypothetical protein
MLIWNLAGPVLTAFRLLDAIPTFESETQALVSFRARSHLVTS